MLLAEGLLKEGELEDVTAISAATAAHLRKHERVGRILPDQTPSFWVRDLEYEAKERKRAKRLDEQGPGPEYYYGPAAVRAVATVRERGSSTFAT